MNEEKLGPIRSVMIPTGVVTLVVPSTMVAEVTNITVLTPVSSAAACVVGVFEWRGIRLPVVSFETLSGQTMPQPQPRSKIVIFYPLAGRARVDFFAILSSADPQSRLIDRDQVQLGQVDEITSPFIVETFTLGGTVVGIPDLKAIRDAFELDKA